MNSSTANKKIEYVSKALEVDPNLAAAYEKRGVLYYYQEKYDKVIQVQIQAKSSQKGGIAAMSGRK